MKKPQAMSNKHSQKVFTKTASSIHPKNNTPRPMRGGIRL